MSEGVSGSSRSRGTRPGLAQAALEPAHFGQVEARFGLPRIDLERVREMRRRLVERALRGQHAARPVRAPRRRAARAGWSRTRPVPRVRARLGQHFGRSSRSMGLAGSVCTA